jgi:uncharacterized protein YbjT (DUF2867 family)/uncharacterized protein YndB with AHSA1/START domain
MRVLVTGASGYLGSRLIPALVAADHRVRCMVRDAGRFDSAAFGGVEVVEADALRPETLATALVDIDVAYYLIHSMAGRSDFAEHDRRAAAGFARAAAEAGVTRIIYLGGLGHGPDLSPHLRSRQETGDVLRTAGVPVTEFRAGIIVGSGSASFEMIRALTERLPFMVAPRWVLTRAQPIAAKDVVRYLVECLDLPTTAGRTYEIGGADVMTYRDMMLGYAGARGLRRAIVVVPVLTPRLSSYWVSLVSPVPATIAQPLIEGLRHEAVARDLSALSDFAFRPMSYRAALELALDRMLTGEVQSVWAQSASASRLPAHAVRLTGREGMIAENRSVLVNVSPARAFALVTSLGGRTGWLYANPLWRLRGTLDRLSGGTGMRRGRRHPTAIRVGDPIDFWRVEAVEPGSRVLLRAEMKLPGRAWLEFVVTPEGAGTRIAMTALFEPKGVWGRAYWWSLYPAHRFIFGGMLREAAARLERAAA